MADKRKKAAAIKYESTKDNAPKVVAKGHGIIAENIIKKAEEYGVHIEEDPDLVEVLAKLEINEEIPEKLYKAFAFILAELYKINDR
jgi:flagellar biosynthesis protein